MLQSYLEKIVQESESELLSPRDIEIREIINSNEMRKLDPRENEYSFSSLLTLPIGYIDPYRRRYYYNELYGNPESSIFLAQYDYTYFLIRTHLSSKEYGFAQHNLDILHRNTFLNFECKEKDLEYSSVIGYQPISKTFATSEMGFVSFNIID
ncbi:MAG: hypothetical protein RBS01_04050 [Candidatus Dojkabacteria bacterium]|jgi:hypothetical protein|nr:hypothetical protein [Candidatus Dojkabacteria bacterium]